MDETRGLLHLYMGNGKGKTTAAVGLCVRCIGAGKRVFFAQFLKGRPTAELDPLRRLGVEIRRTDPVLKFVRDMNERERADCEASCRGLFSDARAKMKSGEYGLIVLDEALDAVNLGFVGEEELCAALTERAAQTEAVLTGRSPGAVLLEAADYISEIGCLRHPYQRGIAARRGIEY